MPSDDQWNPPIVITQMNVPQPHPDHGVGLGFPRHRSVGHLSYLLQHQGEHPEVEHDLGPPGASGRRGPEVQQQHIAEEAQEGEVHDDVPQEHRDRRAPEPVPAPQEETPPHSGTALTGAAGGGVSGEGGERRAERRPAGTSVVVVTCL